MKLIFAIVALILLATSMKVFNPKDIRKSQLILTESAEDHTENKKEVDLKIINDGLNAI